MPTLIIRPTANYGSSDRLLCSSGSSDYMLINEEVADNDTTYAYGNVTTTDSNSMSIGIYNCVYSITKSSAYRITAAEVCIVAKTTKSKSADAAQLAVNFDLYNIKDDAGSDYSSSMFSGYSGYVNVSTEYAEYRWKKTAGEFGRNAATNGFFFSKTSYTRLARIFIRVLGKKQNSKNDDFQIRITQAYAIITYEEVSEPDPGTSIYLKQNGAYAQAQAIYKKVNGVWTTTDKSALDTSAKYKIINT